MKRRGLLAVTRSVSASLGRCELTHLPRVPIDVSRARAQHAAYERLLRSLGASIVRVAAAPDLPDAVFVEDVALVLDEAAVLTRPGAPSRRAEAPAVAAVLARYRRRMHSLTEPATLDGGDVLRIGRTLYVGRSARTNPAGIDQLERLVTPLGYRVRPVEFAGCLHLKSAVTEVADGRLIANPAWVSTAQFQGCEALPVDEGEPMAANVLRVGGTVVASSQYPRTLERLARSGLQVAEVDCSELAKAEGAVTCCSLIFENGSGAGEGSPALSRSRSG